MPIGKVEDPETGLYTGTIDEANRVFEVNCDVPDRNITTYQAIKERILRAHGLDPKLYGCYWVR